MSITNLKPALLWKYFDNICSIPHPSKHEEQLSKYVQSVGKQLDLKTTTDSVGNVLIQKSASKGMENKKTIVLQAHLDMVPQKNSNISHDFEKDPIKAYVDGDWVTAKDTTLGADNGIGVAAALAVLESKDIKHGPIEALFTIDEETGMTGAFGLKPDFLKGDILLNLDTEDDGVLCIGCAGGINLSATADYIAENAPNDHIAFQISLKGLKGGHSGCDIHLGRGNANKLMFRFFHYANDNFNIRISELDGGGLRNAIPREAFAVITVSAEKENELLKSVDTWRKTFKDELVGAEDSIIFEINKVELPKNVVDKAFQERLIKAVCGIPNGVMRMINDLPEVVETSSNLARVIVKGGNSELLCLLRSSVDSSKDDLCNSLESVFSLANFNVAMDGSYPGWKPDFNSSILETMKECYKKMFNSSPEVEVVHAGLECGIIGAVYPNMELISFGPTIKFPHSPDEKVHIGDVEKFWAFLLEILINV